MKNYKKFKEKYDDYRVMTVDRQQELQGELVKLFKEFWDNNPTEDEFAECMTGMVMFARYQYYMSISKLKKHETTVGLHTENY